MAQRLLSREEIGVKHPQSGGDNLLHVSVCCKSLASQLRLKRAKEMDITGARWGVQGGQVTSEVRLSIRGLVISIYLDGLRITWLASDLQQTPT
jgi:hypothetical protein